MKTIYPPIPEKNWNAFHVFLAGSIEMGQAEDWQTKLSESLSDLSDDLVLMNPRRKEWDSSWIQSISNTNFKEQVDWEMDHLESCSLAAFYFDPQTKSPVTMLELGLTVGQGDVPVVVCCPEGFWRKGNVEILCYRFQIPLLSSLDELSKYIRKEFNEEIQMCLNEISYHQKALADYKNGV